MTSDLVFRKLGIVAAARNEDVIWITEGLDYSIDDR